MNVKPKPKSAQELHHGGQRTTLDLAVEMLRHVTNVCLSGCRYCTCVDLFDADVDWLVTREAARVEALARAAELEARRADGSLTDDERAEYRQLRDSGLVGPEDDVTIQLRVCAAQAGAESKRHRRHEELRAAARYVADLYFRSEVNGQSWPTDAERAMEGLRELLRRDG